MNILFTTQNRRMLALLLPVLRFEYQKNSDDQIEDP